MSQANHRNNTAGKNDTMCGNEGVFDLGNVNFLYFPSLGKSPSEDHGLSGNDVLTVVTKPK